MRKTAFALFVLALAFFGWSLRKRPQPRDRSAAGPRSTVFREIERKRLELNSQPTAPTAEAQNSLTATQEAARLWGHDTTRAIELLKQAVADDPRNIEAYAKLSDYLLSDPKRKDEAREAAIACLSLDPRESVCHRTLVSLHTRSGDFDQVMPYLQDCLQLDPANTTCVAAMVNEQLRRGSLSEAKAQLDELKRQDPQALWTILAEAEYERATGRNDLSRNLFAQACEMGQAYACTQAR